MTSRGQNVSSASSRRPGCEWDTVRVGKPRVHRAIECNRASPSPETPCMRPAPENPHYFDPGFPSLKARRPDILHGLKTRLSIHSQRAWAVNTSDAGFWIHTSSFHRESPIGASTWTSISSTFIYTREFLYSFLTINIRRNYKTLRLKYRVKWKLSWEYEAANPKKIQKNVTLGIVGSFTWNFLSCSSRNCPLVHTYTDIAWDRSRFIDIIGNCIISWKKAYTSFLQLLLWRDTVFLFYLVGIARQLLPPDSYGIAW